jgi:hypothetical protein
MTPRERAPTRAAVAAERDRRTKALAARMEEIEALLARPFLGDAARAALTRERAALLRRRGRGTSQGGRDG